MTTAIPYLETTRLSIRPFQLDDLEDLHRLMSEAWDEPRMERDQRLPEREAWLRWSIANYEALASMAQPADEERAVVLRTSGALIGTVGLVTGLGPFRQLPGFPDQDGSDRWYSEVGLFWSIDPAHQGQGQGYATEAASALIDRAMDQFHLARVIATTSHDNQKSIAVMRKLGMHILRNPLSEPAWFQVVGVLQFATWEGHWRWCRRHSRATPGCADRVPIANDRHR